MIESPTNTTLGLLAPGLPPAKRMIAKASNHLTGSQSVIPEWIPAPGTSAGPGSVSALGCLRKLMQSDWYALIVSASGEPTESGFFGRRVVGGSA